MSRVADYQQNFVNDVLPAQVEEPAVPVELTTLQPWHRPRKQFVRERQWIHYSRLLIERERDSAALPVPVEGDPEVRYLTLPGIDYIDVRMLGEMCRKMHCLLTSTGFIAGSEDNPQVARAKIRESTLVGAGYITERSHTFARRFEELADDGGQAMRELERKGPFHIINVDPCGSIASPNAQHARRIVDAIHKVIEFQIDKMAGRWLLFLTADVRPESLAPETFTRLTRAIVRNAEQSNDFRRRMMSVFNGNHDDVESIIREASSNGGQTYLKLFSLGFAKWLLHLARNKDWDLKTHSSYCYSTAGGNLESPTMTCLAFEFVPPPRTLRDEFGVSRAPAARQDRREDTSMRAIEKVSRMDDLDLRLRSSNALRRDMAERTRLLLHEAGYADTALNQLDGLSSD